MSAALLKFESVIIILVAVVKLSAILYVNDFESFRTFNVDDEFNGIIYFSTVWLLEIIEDNITDWLTQWWVDAITIWSLRNLYSTNIIDAIPKIITTRIRINEIL